MEVGVFPDNIRTYAFELRLKFFDLSDVAFEVVLLVPRAGAALVQEPDEELLGVLPGALLGVWVGAAGWVPIDLLVEDKSVPRVPIAHVVVEELGGNAVAPAKLQYKFWVRIPHVRVDKPHKVGDDPVEQLVEALRSAGGPYAPNGLPAVGL